VGWIEEQMRATRFQFPDPGVPFALDSKAMHVEKRSTGRDELDAAFEILTKWFSLTRLETRTKESNIYASIWAWKPLCAMKVNRS
jgi:hypothetical protein